MVSFPASIMPDDLVFLSEQLHPADKILFKKWKLFLDSASKTRVE